MAAGISPDQGAPRQPADGTGDTARTLATLLQIERDARHARTEASFRFVVVNDTRRLVDYDQAVLWRRYEGGKIRVEAVSGVADISRETPYIHWLEQVISQHAAMATATETRLLEPGSTSGETAANWQEMVSGDVLWCPFLAPDGLLVGGLWLSRTRSPWLTSDRALLERLADAYTHAWLSLTNKSRTASHRFVSRLLAGRKRLTWLLLLLVVMLIPVRQTALAPAEVIPYEPVIVTAPMDGVVREIHVEPNAPINAGELLFSLDDTTLRNRHEIAIKAAEVARANYVVTSRKALQNEDSKADLAMLRAEVELRQAEAQYTEELLRRIHVHAERDGIAIFTAVNDWLGRPVITGEKVMTLADPAQTEIRLWLPIDDAINLETGAAITLLLNVNPTQPLSGTLRQTSYEAQVTPEGNLAYQLKASFRDNSDVSRIGLRGTGKVYGKRVLLVQYLLRRPFSALRRFTGL
jgi:hypothetical protein